MNSTKARQRTVRGIWTIKRNLKEFQPESPSNPNMGNEDKDKEQTSKGPWETTLKAPGMPTRSTGKSAVRGRPP